MFLLDFRLECQYSNKILVQNLNLWSNIEILVANQNFGRKFGSIPKNWWKIEVLVKIGILIQYRKIEIVEKSEFFGRKWKLWSKIKILVENQNFLSKIEILVENRNYGRKSKFCLFSPFFEKKKLRRKNK